MSTLTPYSATALEAQLERLGIPKNDHLIVAVSGGADSMALALLISKTRSITAITVDHDLRPESASETRQVGAWLSGHAIDHRVVKWSGEKPSANIQALARQARYELLAEQAALLNSRWILTGHHMDDQAETILVRLARGSGLAGLSGMAALADVPFGSSDSGAKLVRPLLDVPRERLVLALEAMGQEWIEDPSNRDDRYDRIKARNMLENPPLEGLTSARLSDTARSMARAQSAINHYVSQLRHEAVQFTKYGPLFVDLAMLRDAPDEVALRLLAELFKTVGSGDYPPRFAKLEDMYRDLSDDMAGRTLGGVLVIGVGRGQVAMMREIAAAPPPMDAITGGSFDGRWHIASDTYVSVGYVGAGGDIDLEQIPEDFRNHKSLIQSLVWGRRKDDTVELLSDGDYVHLCL